jgi:hypothetical protein
VARRRNTKLEVSMFPFLSVLCTVIGVLMLLIVMVVSSRAERVEPERGQSPPPALPPVEATVSHESGLDDQQYQQIMDQILQLAGTLGERQQELLELNQSILELEDLIAAKEDESFEIARGEGLLPGVELEKPEDVAFVPVTNQRVTKQPQYVEVTADAYIAQPGNQQFAAGELQDPNSPLCKFLQQMDQDREKKYLVFLIHPNGVHGYQDIEEYLLEHYPHPEIEHRGTLSRIDMGKEPFSRGWQFVRQQDESSTSQE